MRGSQPMRSTTSTTSAAAIERSSGNGRCSEIHAMPGTISASATVSQPFSSAKVSASASAATVPVANSAPAAARPGRGSRLCKHLGRDPEQRGQQQREAGERDRALEIGDAVVERDQDDDRREHGGGAPQDRDRRVFGAALREEARDAEQRGEAGAEHEMRRDVDAPRLPAPRRAGRPARSAARSGCRAPIARSTKAANSAAIGTAAVAASVRQAITTVAAVSTANAMSAAPSCRLASTSTPAANR